MALSATCVHECRTTGLDDFNTVSAVVAVGGTLYTVGDVLTVSGGTSTTAATFTVATVTAGVVTSVTPTNTGHYTVLPANPVSTTGGTGTLCTLTITWNAGGNGGIFDPGQVTNASNHAFTDLTTDTNTGNTATPIVSSVSYAFVAGDNGAWIYQATSGGAQGWINGWFQITAVSGGKATLNAAIGAVVLANYTLNTAVGISTNATPTGGIYAIDYSQQAGPQWNYTDLSSTGNGLTVSSAAHPFGRQQVGNSVCVMSGTTFTVGRYVIASVSGTTATVQGAANIHTGAGTNSDGAGALGGPYLSPGQAGALVVAGNDVFIKSGTYTISSTSSNVSGGIVSITATFSATTNISHWEGYNSLRGDKGTKPLLQVAASGVTSVAIVTCSSNAAFTFDNIAIDGQSKSTIKGLSDFRFATIIRCKISNCTNNCLALGSTSVTVLDCEIAGASTQPAIAPTGVGTLISGCYIHGGTITAVKPTVNGVIITNCIIESNSVAGSHGIDMNGQLMNVFNCSIYNNGGSGINVTGNSALGWAIENCIIYSNGAIGIATAGASDGLYVRNCAFGANTGGAYTAANLPLATGTVTLTADPFTNAAGGNFALTPAAIALIGSQAIPGAMPGLPLSVGYLAIGALMPLARMYNPIGSSIIQALQEGVLA